MSKRSIVLGLLCASLLCAVCYFNDFILQQTFLTGNNMPVAVYGLLILFVAAVNPLLGRLRLRGGELAVIIALTLAVCCVPSSGLMRLFDGILMIPHHRLKTTPGWQQQDVLSLVPPQMLADPSLAEDTALTGFMQGLGSDLAPIGLADVPWSAWRRAYLFWVPLLLSLWFSLLALSPMLHRQWSEHEHLPYPVSEFASSLMPDRTGGLPAMLRQRMFWAAAAIVFLIHFNNYLCRWQPDVFIPIQTSFSFAPLTRLFPTFQRGGGGGLMMPTMYFCVIGLAYFLASDVVLSCGIGPYLWCLVSGAFATYGISLTQPLDGIGGASVQAKGLLSFGAALGMALMVLYLGRRYYASALRSALGCRGGDRVEPHVVWGLRAFLALAALVFAQLCAVGLDWPLALVYTLVLYLFFIMMSRVMAETGIFYMQPGYMPHTVVWALFGAAALGPHQLAIMLMLSMVLTGDPRETLLPYVASALKVNESQRLPNGRVLPWCFVALGLGLAIAMPVTLYIQYRFGVPQSDWWSYSVVPAMPFDNLTAVMQKLRSQNLLEPSLALSGLGRLGSLRPEGAGVLAMAAGAGLVLLFSCARLHLTWWPLHPVMFLVWLTEPQRRMAGAFLVGWAVKSLVQKYGGARCYQQLKPAMLGLVAGEILGAIVPCLISAVYYGVTHEVPPRFMVLPS